MVRSGTAVLLRLCAFLTLCAFAQGLADAAQAEELDRVVLEVRYEDGSERAAQHVTLAQIMNLPQAGFETNTIWTEGVQSFEGVWLKDLFAHLQIDAGVVELSALNEYLVDFDTQDVAQSQALVAYRQNGTFLSPRNRGPLWVVFPYDRGPEFQTEMTYVASIWQLDLMVALP